MYANGAAKWHAQLQVSALVLEYKAVDLGSSTYTMPGLQYFPMMSIFPLFCDSSVVVKDTWVRDATLIYKTCSARQDLSNELLIIIFGSALRKLWGSKDIGFRTKTSFISVHLTQTSLLVLQLKWYRPETFACTTSLDGGQSETIFVQIGLGLVHEGLQAKFVTPGRSYKDHRGS